MKKLLSLLVAAVFAVSSGFAVAASHAGAPMKKDEMKKGDGKDGKKAAKKSAKKDDKKSAKKDEKKSVFLSARKGREVPAFFISTERATAARRDLSGLVRQALVCEPDSRSAISLCTTAMSSSLPWAMTCSSAEPRSAPA